MNITKEQMQAAITSYAGSTVREYLTEYGALLGGAMHHLLTATHNGTPPTDDETVMALTDPALCRHAAIVLHEAVWPKVFQP